MMLISRVILLIQSALESLVCLVSGAKVFILLVWQLF